MRTKFAAAIILVAGTQLFAHRLDEYLQGTILDIDKSQVRAQMTLTPGVAVFPILIADIDIDANGAISETEQRAYGRRVLQDLSLAIDGHPLTPELVSIRFPTIDEMKEGRGEIQLDFYADLPPGDGNRRLTLENHHHSGISAYQVNCLIPRDPEVRIVAQDRNYSQSSFQLNYKQASVASDSRVFTGWSGAPALLGAAGLLQFARFALMRRKRARS